MKQFELVEKMALVNMYFKIVLLQQTVCLLHTHYFLGTPLLNLLHLESPLQIKPNHHFRYSFFFSSSIVKSLFIIGFISSLIFHNFP